MVKLGLPWGSKPILTHLNSEALRHGSPEIEVGNSLTAFVQRIRGFGPGGREIRMFKDQLGRLSASLVRLALTREGRSFQINTQIVTAFDLWFPKDELSLRSRTRPWAPRRLRVARTAPAPGSAAQARLHPVVGRENAVRTGLPAHGRLQTKVSEDPHARVHAVPRGPD